MKKNYKDDFDFLLKLYSAMVDSSGKEVEDSRRELGWPDYDWVATFWTSSKANAYVASCIGGKCSNCYNDNGQIHIVVDDHHMGPGRLKVEFRAELPREIYPDGYQRNVIPEPLDIELMVGKGDLPSEMEAELLLPYIKGDPFTAEDFTPEQWADLQRPATEAATRADEAVSAAEKATEEAVASNKLLADNVAEAAKAETERVEAEKARATAEAQRQSAEQTRQANEDARVKAEELRNSAETTRESKEAERQNAETDRDIAEKSRVSAEASRIAAETKRASDFADAQTARQDAYIQAEQQRENSYEAKVNEFQQSFVDAEESRQTTFQAAEAERAEAETTRVTNENTRISNEQSRVKAEQTRVSQETARQNSEATRQSNEQSRITAEEGRVSAEDARVSAESARAEAEQQRATEFAGFEGEIDEAKRKVFDDMWLAAVGSYGSIDHSHIEDGVSKPYYLNTLWLTYSEALAIMAAGARQTSTISAAYVGLLIRTHLPRFGGGQTASAMSTFRNCTNLESVEMPNLKLAGDVFTNCRNLRTVCLNGVHIYTLNDSSTPSFQGCAALRELRGVLRAGYDFDISDSPLLSLASMQYIIEHAANSSSITITVHPDIYAKLTDESNTEWYAVLTAAAEKNITFATT